MTEQFEKAFCYTKDIIVDKWGEEFFIEKISSILNYWIIKLNYDKNLYTLACKLCQNKGVLDINRKMLAELAVYNAEAFTQLTEVAKKSLS